MFGFKNQEPDEELTLQIALRMLAGSTPGIAARREGLSEDDLSLWLLRGREDLEKGCIDSDYAALYRVLTWADIFYRRSLQQRMRWAGGRTARAAERTLRSRYGWGTEEEELARSAGIISQLRAESVERAEKSRYAEAARKLGEKPMNSSKRIIAMLAEGGKPRKEKKGEVEDE